MYLSREGIRHIVVDKAVFPRDKICGDALSGKVIYALNRVNPGLSSELTKQHSTFLPSWGISFYAPNGRVLEVPFKSDINPLEQAPGFIATRMDFDHFLVEHLSGESNRIVLGNGVVDATFAEDGVEVMLEDGEKLMCKLIIDASGAHSRIARKHGMKLEPDHHAAGLRQYYEGVSGLHPSGFIELHFVKDILPGYFWIFPMTGGRANVGLGMLSSSVSKRKINLKIELQKIVEEHPVISKRFADARSLEQPKGWGLPFGSKKRTLSFNRLMLCGDAASLIDPFTGEGIGNGMISGKYAAETAVEALLAGKMDADFLRKYDARVYRHLWPELKMSHHLQKMVHVPWLFNFVVNKGRKSAEFRNTLTAMFENVDLRKKFRSPKFYLNLLLNR